MSGCEGIAPTTSAIELALVTLTGTSSLQPSVSKVEGPGTPEPESPGSTSASIRENEVPLYGVRLCRNTKLRSDGLDSQSGHTLMILGKRWRDRTEVQFP